MFLSKSVIAARSPEVLQEATLRDFTGGLNVIDNDQNLERKYAVVLNNMYYASDGSQAVRQGTRFFTDFAVVGLDTVVGSKYYNAFIVAVDKNGLVAIADGTGACRLIFNNAIASLLPGAPAGWSATNYTSFAETPGGLIIMNGVNKPLLVTPSMNCQYLVDPATSSNFFIPPARYVTLSGRYVIMTGDLTAPSTIYIGNRDSYGVFFGTVPPNDGVNINLASRVTIGSPVIRGHCTFRDKIIVFFEKCILVGQLGIYTANVHTPTFEDAIPLYGAIAHNAIKTVGNDVVFPDNFGVQAVSRALFTGLVTPNRQSPLIDPVITEALAKLNTTALADRVFALYNQPEQQYMLFIPTSNDDNGKAETLCAVQTQLRGQSPSAATKPWALFRDWRWRSGCETALGRIALTVGSQVFILGNITDPITADYVRDEDTYTDGTVHTDGRGFTVVPGGGGGSDPSLGTGGIDDSGVPIRFDWILPWADFKTRMSNKIIRYIAFDATGTGRFTCDMFIDNFVINDPRNGETFSDGMTFTDNTGWSPPDGFEYTPALTSEFMAADFGGFGASPFGEFFGSGRLAPDESLYEWPAKCRRAKLRIHGSTKEAVHIVAITLLYQNNRRAFRR